MTERISHLTTDLGVDNSLAVLLPTAPNAALRHCGEVCGCASFPAVAVARSRSNGRTPSTNPPGSSCREVHATGSTPSVIAEVLRCTVSFGCTASTLQAFIGLAMESGPWCAGSITLAQSGQLLSTVAYLGRRAADCDHLQHELGEGPSHDAVSMAPLQAAGDLNSDGRWPEWAARAGSAGSRAVMSLRLFTDTTLGTLNLYAAQPFHIDASIAQGAQVIAAHISTIVAHLVIEEHLHRAVESRTIIGQAQGILMQRHGLTAEKAFAVLRRVSQDNNIKVRVVAKNLVATRNLRICDLAPNE